MTSKEAFNELKREISVRGNLSTFQKRCFDIIYKDLNRVIESETNYHISLAFQEAQKEEMQELRKEFNKIKNILEEYNVTPEILREVLLTGQMFRKSEPTLEEVKQEWEAKDYIWKETEFDIKLITKNPTYYLKIRIFKNSKTYQGIINFQEHQLLTKTFRALGWFE